MQSRLQCFFSSLSSASSNSAAKRTCTEETSSDDGLRFYEDDEDPQIVTEGDETEEFPECTGNQRLECFLDCCTDDDPYHPSADECKSTMKKQGKQIRSPQFSWFSEYAWLTFCLTNCVVFCHFCRQAFGSGQAVPISKKSDQAFVSVGFSNWKKGPEKFRAHEKCEAHKEAISRLMKQKQTPVDLLWTKINR